MTSIGGRPAYSLRGRPQRGAGRDRLFLAMGKLAHASHAE